MAQKIEAVAVKTSRRYEPWHHEITSETIVIVTGCWHVTEVFDRPTAYELKISIDEYGRTLGRKFLYSVVVGDLWFNTPGNEIQNHPYVISLGSPGVNSLSGAIENNGQVIRNADKINENWKIVRNRNRWALFGNLAEGTEDSVISFKSHDLLPFLGEIW